MQLKFWGTRGSSPASEKEKIEAGGETSCIELRIRDRIAVIDAGSGLRQCGASIAKDVRQGASVDLFITHTHIDHIVGFPLFVPLFFKGAKIRIFGCKTVSGRTLKSAMRVFLGKDFWPLGIDDFGAKIVWKNVDAGDIAGFPSFMKVSAAFLAHPCPALGYRFESDGKSVCFIFDHESDGKGFIRSFIEGADTVVFDAPYTEDEYTSGKVGWGHSSYERALKVCEAAKIKSLIFTHHNPERTDSELFALEEKYAALGKEKNINVCMARAGAVFEV